MEIHLRADSNRDVQWINLALAFLKTYAEGTGRDLVMDEDDKIAYLNKVISFLKNAADGLSEGQIHFRLPCFDDDNDLC